MRSAMVRSSSSATSASSNTQQEPEVTRIEDLESPMGQERGFEGGRLTTDNGIINNNAALTNTSETSADRDPSIIYIHGLDYDPLRNGRGSPLFYIKSARIFPQDSPGEISKVKKYVSYEIALLPMTTTSDVNLSPTLGTIFRRYTDFLRLYEGLRQDYASLMQAIVFPKKCFLGNFSFEVVEPRIWLFTDFIEAILNEGELRDSEHFRRFLQDQELEKACRLLDERRSEEALPILENLFVLLSKFYTDRSKDVLLVLCRLVAASSHPIPAPDALKWAELTLKRFDGVCDSDLLQLYVPLIKACVYLFWKTGRDKSHLDAQLDGMRKRGINVKSGPTLSQAIHKLDPRTESA